MPLPSTFTCYADIAALRAETPGAPFADLLAQGGDTTLSGPVAVGATALPVVSSAYVTAGAPVYVLDGATSEIAYADATTPAPDGTHITLQAPGLQFIHSAGVSVSAGGTRGALADLLRLASLTLENYCQQGTPGDRGFIAKARTERNRMPTTRAMLDSWGSIMCRPRSFPVQSVSALAIEYAPGSAIALDTTMIEMSADGQEVRVPYAAMAAGQRLAPQFYDVTPVGRGSQAWLVLSYTAGFTWAAFPYDIIHATCLAAMELMGYRMNPTGAALVRQGDSMIEQRLRGSGGKESSADGLFLTEAKLLMQPYRARFI